MANAEQIDADRRNSRAAAGLAADEARAAEDRAAQWNSSLRPINAFEVWIVDQVAVESLRIEACRRRDAALRADDARRASDPDVWDSDRKAEAQALGSGLARNPALVMARLRRTKHGCLFLAERWTALKELAERKAAWNEVQRAMAMDLLGTPKELREGLDPLGVEGLEGDALAEAQRLLASREIDQLAPLVVRSLSRRDADERAMTADGTPPELSKALERTRRYEAACQRRMNWALAQLKRKGKSIAPANDDRSSWVKPEHAEIQRTPDAAARGQFDAPERAYGTMGSRDALLRGSAVGANRRDLHDLA